jgi:hypothetical protein
MGQHISRDRQATPTRPQHGGTRTTSKQQTPSRENGLVVDVTGGRVKESWPRVKRSSLNSKSAHTVRSSTTPQNQYSSWHEERVVSAERQRLYELGKIMPESEGTWDHGQRRLHRVDSHHQPSNTTDRSHTPTSLPSKPHSHHQKTKECIVCTESRGIHHFPSRLPTHECTHNASVCRRCLRTWIDSHFITKIWNEITCPICPSMLQPTDIHAFASEATSRRYDTLAIKAAKERIPNFTWCIAKNCTSGQVHEPGTVEFRCEACKECHCVDCGVKWHRRKTCAKYERRMDRVLRKEEEEASRRVVDATTKGCPGCRRRVGVII